MLINGLLTASGIDALIDQSQKGSRSVMAAASYSARTESGYVVAIL